MDRGLFPSTKTHGQEGADRGYQLLGADRIAPTARLDFDHFLDKEVTRVYLAGRLSEAKHVERTLSENGIDYAVDIEPFLMLILGIFPSEYAGTAFYVPSGQAPFARSTLLAAGLKVDIEDDEAG